MQGTSIIIRPCDLPYVWMRCGLLMMIKPAASSVARWILKRKMRKTLIGKKTIHGVSAIVSKQLQRQKMAKIGAMRRAQSQRKVAGAAHHLARDAKMELVEEELVALRDELSVSGLDFDILFTKAMKKWKFFTCVVTFQLFSCFPVHHSAPGRSVTLVATNLTADIELAPLPIQSVWMYLEPATVYAINDQLSDKYRTLMMNHSSASSCRVDGFPD